MSALLSQIALSSPPGQCGELLRDFNWAATALGPREAWPQSLRTPVDILLRSPLAMVLMWGNEGTLIYNDAYIAVAGTRHPAAFGLPVGDAWPEVAGFNHGIIARVLEGESISLRDQRVRLERAAGGEDVWFDLDYVPVLDESGTPRGTLAIVVETTRRFSLIAALAAEKEATAELNARLTAESENLRKLFRDAPSFMCVLRGPDHVFELTNASYLKLIGHRDVLGKPVREALPEVVGQGFTGLLDQVYASGKPYIGKQVKTLLQVTPDGAPEEHFHDFVYQPLTDADGRVTGIFVEGIDVTESTTAQAEIRAREEQFASLAEAAPLHVWAADPQGALYWFNARVYESTGEAPGSLDGANWGKVVHPDDLPGAAQTWGKAIVEGGLYETEFRIWSAPHKAYRWYLVRALPVTGEHGAILRWIGTNTDIEDRKVAAGQLNLLNTSLEGRVAERTAERDRLWRLSTELLVITDADGAIVSANPFWSTLLGWTDGELTGTNLFRLIHPDDLARTREEASHLAAGRSMQLFENRYRHKDGSYRWISWTAVPDGGFLHGVGRDITATRQAAEALHNSEEALRQAQKMEAVGQLTGGLAHDFNNLLQGIVGSMELVRRLIGAGRLGEVDRFINSAMASAHRAAALTHRLLAFSRRQPLDPKPVKVNRLVASMEDLLRRSVPPSIQMELVLAAGLWVTRCDANQVENAILNLVLNARDAMPGGGTVVVETANAMLDSSYVAHANDVKPGQYVCISVTDNGTGMSPDTLARAFDPFFTTKPTGEGTGLGLSMVYGFARQSEGYAKIYSEAGKGTTIKLYLPRYRGPDVPDATSPELPAVEMRRDTRTVLLVEDESVVRALVAHVLQDLGYRVIEAEDGPGGLRILESDAVIDLLLTDVGLPGLNGRQVADAGRKLRPGLKVLFMTGYAENAAVANGFLEPDMQMVTKPFAMETLARRITDMIDAPPRGGK